jgi:hypothetical protein
LSGWHFRPASGEVPYAIVIWLRRAVTRRYFVDYLAVQHVRHGTLATHTKFFATRHLGRSAEGKNSSCADAGAIDRDVPPPPPGVGLIDRSRSRVGIRAEHGPGEDFQAGEIRQQLQRWLRNKL